MEENQNIPPLPDQEALARSEGKVVLGPVPEGQPPVFLKRSAKNAAIHKEIEAQKTPEIPEPKHDSIEKPKDQKKGFREYLSLLSLQEKLFGMFAMGFISCAVIVGLFSWGLLSQLQYEPIENITDEQPVQLPLANDIESAHEQLLENIENNSSVIKENVQSNSRVLWTGAEGYLLGTYVAVEDGQARQAPLSNAEVVFDYKAGDSAEVSAIEDGLNNSVWGMIGEDTWILLQQDNTIAAIGPGQYRTLRSLEILSGTGSPIGTMHSDEVFIAEKINHFGSDIYGILENGSMVLMKADSLERVSEDN